MSIITIASTGQYNTWFQKWLFVSKPENDDIEIEALIFQAKINGAAKSKM